MKRILYAFIIILVVFLIIYLGFRFGYKGDQATPNTTSTSQGTSNGSFPTDQVRQVSNNNTSTTPLTGTSVGDVLSAGELLFGKLLNKNISSYRVTPSSTVVFVESSGAIGIASGTTVESLSAAPVPTMLRSSISYDGKKALVILGASVEQASVFDTQTRIWELLPKDAQEAVWAPTTEEVAYLSYKADGGVDLIALNLQPAKHTSRTLLSFTGYDLKLNWVNPEIIIISERSTALVPTSAWTFNIKTKTLTPVATDQLGNETIWDPSVNSGLALTSDGKHGGHLAIRSNQGAIKGNFTLLTLPSKCLFEPNPTSSLQFTVPSTALICGIPRNADILSGAQIPDDYNKWNLYTIDDLYRVRLADGNIELLRSKDDESLDVSQLSVVSSTLFFVNRYDNGLYFLKLPKAQ